MRTVRRESLKLNQSKFDALERIARAFASDKQAHLDFYQHHLNFSEAHSYRLRRNELKTTDHHASTPLPVHASDLAVKEAFETEVKYWAAVAAELHPRIALRQWIDEQKNASKEKIRRMTVPGQTLERDEAPGTKSSRQSKSETATGKSTKSVAIR
jgi:hypothetical protein